MKFLTKILFYSLFLFTTGFALYYLWQGVFPRGANPFYMKQWLALASLLVLAALYRAFQLGKQQGRYEAGLGVILLSWLAWGAALGVIYVKSLGQ